MKWKRYGQKMFRGKCFPALTKNIYTQKKKDVQRSYDAIFIQLRDNSREGLRFENN